MFNNSSGLEMKPAPSKHIGMKSKDTTLNWSDHNRKRSRKEEEEEEEEEEEQERLTSAFF